MKKIILYGAGNAAEYFISIYGKETIEYICDVNITGKECYGIRMISLDQLEKIHDNYRVIISINKELIIADAKRKLNSRGIDCEIGAIDVEFIHIYGMYPNLTIKNVPPHLHFRSNPTISMFNEAFEIYSEYFINKEIDYWIYVEDSPSRAKMLADLIGVKKMFAYSSTYAVHNSVIPIPDYKFVNSGLGNGIETKYEDAMNICIQNGEKCWKDSRAFWIGNLEMHMVRNELKCLEYYEKDKLKIVGQVSSGGKMICGEYIPMLRWYEYKYLIDAPGYAWTDRTKYLLAMGRVLLFIDRQHKEYYWERLEPMVHYVPIKPDLSDLIEKIDFLNDNPSVYYKIVNEATKFVRENFTKEKIIRDLYGAILLQFGEK